MVNEAPCKAQGSMRVALLESSRNAYTAGTECHTELYSSGATGEIVPLVMNGHVVKVRCEADAAKEDVVAHIIS